MRKILREMAEKILDQHPENDIMARIIRRDLAEHLTKLLSMVK